MTRTDRCSARAVERISRGARNALIAAALAFCCGPQAHAEKADREKPIHLEADRVTVDEAKQIAVFEGNVVLTQGTLMIKGDRMQVRQDDEGFRHGTTWGDLAYFRQLGQLPVFMDYLESVVELDRTRSRWTAKLPVKGTVEWEDRKSVV